MAKRVLLASGSFYGQVTGGSEYQQFLLANYLKQKGYDVCYLFIDNGSQIKYESCFKLIKIKKRNWLRRVFGSYFFLDTLKFYKILKRIRPQAILTRGGFSFLASAARYGQVHNCKTIWHIASKKDIEPFRYFSGRYAFFDFIDKKFLEFGLNHVDAIVGQAEYQDKILFKNYKRRCDYIIPNFHPVPAKSIEKRSPIRILWIANLKKLKNPEIFFKLAETLTNQGNVKFIMIGRYGSYGRKKELLSQIKKNKNIELKGELPLEEVNNFLNQAHILVNTSTYEGFPNTFIQAWMRKVPVVSLNVDPDDIIKKNKIGFVSETFSKLVEDVQFLINNALLREQMGEKAQAYAFKNFSLRNMEKLIKAIEN